MLTTECPSPDFIVAIEPGLYAVYCGVSLGDLHCRRRILDASRIAILEMHKVVFAGEISRAERCVAGKVSKRGPRMATSLSRGRRFFS